MSSQVQEPPTPQSSTQGQATTTELQPSRPAPVERHDSSWMDRLHRRNGPETHQHDADLEEPLLSHHESDGEETGYESQSSSSLKPRSRVRGLFTSADEGLQRAYQRLPEDLAQKTKPYFVAFLLAVLILLTWLGAHLSPGAEVHQKLPLCLSAACVHAASEILYNLDPNYASLDACSQFDQMVCGGWQERHDLRSDQGDMFTGTLMAERSQSILRHILTEDSSLLLSSVADRENFYKLKDDYDSCMDEKLLRTIGIKPVQEVTDKIKKSFSAIADRPGQSAIPKLENAPHKGLKLNGANQLTETLLLLMDLDIDAFLDFGVQADDRDPDTQIVMISPPRVIGLPSKEYYQDGKLVSEYREMSSEVLRNFITNHTSLLDYQRDSMYLNKRFYSLTTQPEIGDLVSKIVDLEIKLAAATPPAEVLDDVTQYYNPMSVTEVHALLPQVSLDYIISQLAPKGYSPDKIIVGSPSYLKALSTLLTNTREEVLQAFLIWKAVQRYESRVEDSSLKPLRAFNNRLRGLEASAEPERWRTCLEVADDHLGWILSKFFVEKAFSENAKRFGDQIVTDIKDSFVAILGETKWMSNNVRDQAVQKVHAIDQKIGFPTSNPNILDPEALKIYYSDVDISDSTFFKNEVEVAQFETRKAWRKLGRPTRHDEWDMTVPTVNAYYNPAGNEIVFPAGILQVPVFYEPDVPHYLTYGAFGAVSGHELSHAFDSTGSHYDETGNYTDWFDRSTEEAFEERTSCFEKQYSQFTVPGQDGEPLHVNGKLTLGENIADAGGVHAAYLAWKRKEGGGDHTTRALPGLQDFTPEQLFFISYGNWWCGKSTAAKAIERIFTDPHAPKSARILGTMDNSKEFKQAFQCKNVEPACKLW